MDCEQLCAGLDMDMFVSDECCSDSFCSCNEEFGKPQYSCPEGSYFCNAEQSCVTTSCSIRQCCSSDFVPTATSTSTTTTTTTDVCNNFQSGNCPLTEENIVGYMMSETPAECQNICRQISECYYFTWFEKNCYLLYVCDQVSDCECCIRLVGCQKLFYINVSFSILVDPSILMYPVALILDVSSINYITCPYQ